jgi:redox-sensing transcriptional repressor
MAVKVDRRVKIPQTTVRRLSVYYRVLKALERESGDGNQTVSSEDIAALAGSNAAQVRRDLTYFGQFGKRGVGYKVSELKAYLAEILGIDREWPIALVGVGNLGSALLAYRGLPEQGFRICAAFDRDPAKIGRRVGEVEIYDAAEIVKVVQEKKISMAIITVPAHAAQEVADRLVEGGVKGILNFAPVQLIVPDGVTVSNVDLAIEMEGLSYALTHGGWHEL